MTFSFDWNLATLVAIGVQIIVFIGYLIKTNGKAHAAHELAEKANKRAEDAHMSIAAVNASLSMTREQVAREHPDHDALELMEKRLTEEIHRIGNRLDQIVDRRPGGTR